MKKAAESTAKGKRLKVIKTPQVPQPEDSPGSEKGIFGIFGTESLEAQYHFFIQALNTMGITMEDFKVGKEKLMEYVHTVIAGINPKNVLEGMLAIQMFGAHNMIVEFQKRAVAPQQCTEGVDANVARATRIMRVFLEQIAVMQKLKGQGSQQKVTVEHVHVHQGGQAIVGAVTSGGEGEG